MDPRSPVDTPRFPDPGFGPFDGAALAAEINRADAARALNCAAAQVATILVAALAIGLFALLSWSQIVKYEAALAACAGV